jgi:hypothetical protein
MYNDNIEDVPTSQPTDDGILDQVCSVALHFLFDYDNLSIIPKLRTKFSKLLRFLLILIGMFRPIRLDHTNCLQVAIKTQSSDISRNGDQQGDDESSIGDLLYECKKRIAQEAWTRYRLLVLFAQEGAQTSPSNDVGKSSQEVGIVINSGIVNRRCLSSVG